MDQLILRETQDMLSFRATLRQSLKQISLRAVPLKTILDDIAKYRSSYIDDGYRAIHLYYQRDNPAYPIEVQLWCGKDFLFNLWSHRHLYKYLAPKIGQKLYQEYSHGLI